MISILAAMTRHAESTHDEPEVACGWCTFEATLADAIETGWVPCHWQGDTWIEGPMCPACAEDCLCLDEATGEWEEM